MAYPGRKFPKEYGAKDPRELLQPVGIFSGMTKREAMCDGKHAPVQNMPRGTTSDPKK